MEDVVTRLQDGTRVHVSGDTLDIVHRLQYGDPTMGWEGDESMLVFAEDHGFQVWAKDHTGEPYIVVDRHPSCDSTLIARVRDSDSRRADVLLRLARIEEARVKAQADRLEDLVSEHGDRLQFALRTDQGQHFGGLTRTNLLNDHRKGH